MARLNVDGPSTTPSPREPPQPQLQEPSRGPGESWPTTRAATARARPQSAALLGRPCGGTQNTLKGTHNNTKLNYACDASVDACVSVICDRVPSSNASMAASKISNWGEGANLNQGLISTNPRGNSDFALMGSTSLFIKTCASKFKRPSIRGLSGRV